MKIAMNLLVRDEEDIIEPVIRYHAAMGVDKFWVMDHLSKDRTRDILVSLASEYDITVIIQDDPAYHQHLWMSVMGRVAAQAGMDWIINGDADEFWWCEKGLKETLAAIPADVDSLQCWWVDVLPNAEFSAAPLQNPVVRPGTMYKTMMRPHEGISVSVGNHWVYSSKKPWQLDGIKVYHFSDRSPRKVLSKCREGLDSLKATGYPEWVGGHWKDAANSLAEAGEAEFLSKKFPPMHTLLGQEGVSLDYRMVSLLRQTVRQGSGPRG